MKIYLVRHGQVNSNVLKVYNRREEDLNEKGVEQAKQLKEKIKNLDYELIIASSLLRARHTANIINVNNKKMILDNRLIERNSGNLGGLSYEQTDREEYWNYNTTLKQGTEEDIKEFFARVYNFLDELKGKDYKSVLIVAHNGVSKAFSAYFDGMGDGKFLHRGIENCEVKEYEL